MEYFDTDKLKLVLQSLPHWKRVAFMAACCERMLPNYRSFSSESGFGEPALLSEALSKVWHWIETSQCPEDVDAIVAKCEQQVPNTEEFDSIYTSAAVDAANSIAAALEALNDTTEERAVEVASLSRDTVDLFVQETNNLDPNSPDLERQIAEATLLQAELHRQKQSLEYLKDGPSARHVVIAEVRAKFSERSLPERLI